MVIKDAIGDGDKLKVARGKLHAIGNMTRHCATVNSGGNIERMCADLWSTASIVEILRADAVNLAAKKVTDEGQLLGLAEAVAAKLEAESGDLSKVTMVEI